jgi:hypothetical protein
MRKTYALILTLAVLSVTLIRCGSGMPHKKILLFTAHGEMVQDEKDKTKIKLSGMSNYKSWLLEYDTGDAITIQIKDDTATHSFPIAKDGFYIISLCDRSLICEKMDYQSQFMANNQNFQDNFRNSPMGRKVDSINRANRKKNNEPEPVTFLSRGNIYRITSNTEANIYAVNEKAPTTIKHRSGDKMPEIYQVYDFQDELKKIELEEKEQSETAPMKEEQ